MWRLRIDQCWKPKRVGLPVSEERDSSQGERLDAAHYQVGFSLTSS